MNNFRAAILVPALSLFLCPGLSPLSPDVAHAEADATRVQWTTANVAQRLADTPVSAEFDDNALEDVIQFFADLTGVPVHAQFESMARLGLLRDTPVTLAIQAPNAEVALRQLSDHLNQAFASAFDFEVHAGRVLIAPREKLNELTAEVRVYAVSDLIHSNHTVQLQAMQEQSLQKSRLLARLIAEPAMDLPKTESPLDFIASDRHHDQDEAQERQQESIDDLILLIENSVGAEIEWGNTATLDFHDNTLVVKAPPSRHAQIAKLFADLRSAKPDLPEQIADQTRALAVLGLLVRAAELRQAGSPEDAIHFVEQALQLDAENPAGQVLLDALRAE
ncbi:MAG: hypothetical protein AAF288_06155 [Planctomycetota bacterium]